MAVPLGVSAIYLVDESGSTIGSSGIADFAELNNGPNPFPLKDFAAGSTSAAFLQGSDGLLGSFNFTVSTPAPATSDLQLYFQRQGEGVTPITLTNLGDGSTHTPTVLIHSGAATVPEPSSVFLLAVVSLFGFRRNKRCVGL